MDFKVAGTADAVTALQLDTKIDGLPADVLAKALLQAKEARLTILGVMAGAIAEPRDHVANSAPKIVSMEIPIDKIGEVIGPKGKVINTLQQETGADIAVDDDGMVGTVTIGAKDGNAVEEARRRISLILDPPTADVGAVYAGKVVNITKFGAFVNVLPGRDGLLHISKLSSLAGGKRINNVEDVLTLGQPIEVRVDDIDPQGKVSLSLASVPEGSGGGGSRAAVAVVTVTAAVVVTVTVGVTVTVVPLGVSSPPARRSRPMRERVERSDASSSSAAPAPSASNGGAGRPSFEDAFEAELVADLGDLGPGAAEGESRERGGDRRPPRPFPSPLIAVIRLAERHPPGHRDHGGCALGGGGLLGRRRLAGRVRRGGRGLALPRAPALQGHRRPARPRPSPSRSTRWGVTATPSPPRSTPPSTSACWPSTSRSAWTS